MSTDTTLIAYTRDHPARVTIFLSLIGYAVVIGSFAGFVPVPSLTEETTILFGDAIVVINTIALGALLSGWWFIKRGAVRKHQAAMMTSFGLILLFLVLYVWKQAGGFTKQFVISQGQFLADYATLVTYAYWALLGIHVFLSIVAVPVVLYAVLLGITHTPTELVETRHPQIGRIAVWVWSISLALGILTYVLLNHVYGWAVL
ncbi:DUF420 domain-containing protein [Halodesulfurarchaeum sp.]|uniref:DUF420 domain-containing protein n=1 Tax=Halodesulfurarchaeum sp. TaxID=1980530 RepID=UPI001BC398B9|nr:DUF420 domain-containing protein [Halodesulfurarchaeum sp.]